ncbi:hypothetical protein DE146DRAFT_680954 [Phaeosphaeria sp. MPI-PUGE-AT-0046c]|nr:hypothetical protein DE146DRAFT_680954 [Phaeosphaeria sp. MPI-PUGE-AT-0046c]
MWDEQWNNNLFICVWWCRTVSGGVRSLILCVWWYSLIEYPPPDRNDIPIGFPLLPEPRSAAHWDLQAERMEEVFAFAYCTIAATSAVDSNAGFLDRNSSAEYVRVQDTAGNQVSPRKNYFLLDPGFPERLLGSGYRRTVEFIHFLFENYSKRGITKDTDRCVAISGLEACIAGALQCRSKCGIFEKYLHRNLLWQASDTNTKRINYDEGRQVPSWSWMAYGGGIKFMEIAFTAVAWVKALAFHAENYSITLIVDVCQFRCVTLTPDGERHTVSNLIGKAKGWIQYDVKGSESGRREHCVVIGRTEEKTSKRYYYILVVVPTREDWEYARIGVGMVRTSCVKRLVAGVRLV